MSLAGVLATGVWSDFVQFAPYHKAVAAGAVIGLMCGLLSVLVVLRRMAFIGEGISHAAFGGVGVALLAEALLGGAAMSALARDGVIALFCVGTALGIGRLTRRQRVGEDTAIGIGLVAAMALGVILLQIRVSISSAPVPGLETLLFGNMVLIRTEELVAACVLAGATVVFIVGLFKELAFMAFDEETATVFGVRTGLLYHTLLVLLGLAIVAAMRSMGVILASALLILPGATARLWSNRIGVVTAVSAALGVAGPVGGFFLTLWLTSVKVDLSPEPVIVLTLFAAFAASYLFTYLFNPRSRRRSET